MKTEFDYKLQSLIQNKTKPSKVKKDLEAYAQKMLEGEFPQGADLERFFAEFTYSFQPAPKIGKPKNAFEFAKIGIKNKKAKFAFPYLFCVEIPVMGKCLCATDGHIASIANVDDNEKYEIGKFYCPQTGQQVDFSKTPPPVERVIPTDTEIYSVVSQVIVPKTDKIAKQTILIKLNNVRDDGVKFIQVDQKVWNEISGLGTICLNEQATVIKISSPAGIIITTVFPITDEIMEEYGSKL